MVRVRIVVRGRVQGVGFRYFVVLRARELGLSGWVRNLPDGTVEAEAEGPRPQLERLIHELRQGPRPANVTGVDATWSHGQAKHLGFDVAG